MKKIVISMSIILAAAAIVAGGTYAYFTSTSSVEGNTLSTGTLHLTLNKGEGKEIQLSNILPGYADQTYRWFDAYNDGNVPLEYFFKFEKTAGSDELFDALQIELRDGGYTGACDGPVIYSGLLKDFVDNTKISNFNVHAANSDTDPVYDDIRAGWTMRVCQKVAFPETNQDQNDLQGQNVTFSEVVTATQDVNPDAVFND